ncbi:MAG: bifunctional tetrahydrofolate synthase/dihydrofolate synthase [Rhodocyclaceae bacterium]|nr:MAG: bifunctional tetrahydrofolate synthase/dihydrofolate synthase [Rhodocyclaceae bacterium]
MLPIPVDLPGWLAYIEGRHSRPIALGLERLLEVKQRLGQEKRCPVILVGGTNGKGSTCAMLESILLAAGYRVGLYTSPHLLRYNERVRINGKPVDDAALCAGFAKVEAARAETPLTYFEFGTLAAWETFAQAGLDVVIMEVGLGGRLDAVNIYEPDCAIVTTVDMDHMDFLGDTREKIGVEKAGIFRVGVPAICGDAEPPQSLMDHAATAGARLAVLGKDFGYLRQELQWQYWGLQDGTVSKRSGLAFPGLRGGNQLQNASVAIAALDALKDKLPVAMQDIRRGLIEVELTGRFQVLPGQPTIVLDVAHNPQAARVLADNLGNMAFHPETYAVFGMLRDKDMAAVAAALKSRVTRWLPCTLPGPRGATAAELAAVLESAGIPGPHVCFDNPAAALAYAREQAGEGDRIAAFGSFLTVADVISALGRDA